MKINIRCSKSKHAKKTGYRKLKKTHNGKRILSRRRARGSKLT
ncbi:MAG: 50S ribosomal protein L34 [Planctomycetes bacterium]|nr:50S ribosomal protein L34 [Planctomycetota bacterium]